MRKGTTMSSSADGPQQRGNIMSMSTALGAKAKKFGKAVQPKKGRKKKSKKTAGKRKHVDTTDYDSMGAM